MSQASSYIAKLSISTDVHPWIRAEAVAIELARRCGIDVPNAPVIESMGRDVLLIERFDRLPGGRRRHVVSGLTCWASTRSSARATGRTPRCSTCS